ncbi:MAG: hypothetical protein ACXW3T_09860 [Rhodoplanes sp.]
MNVAVTRGAEGFPRRAFSVDDIRRMIDIGLIGPEENFELIEGEIVLMQAKSVAHDNLKHALNLALARAVPDGMYNMSGSRRRFSSQGTSSSNRTSRSSRAPSTRPIRGASRSRRRRTCCS